MIAAAEIIAAGGATFNLAGESPTHGCAVAAHPELSLVVPLSMLTDDLISGFVRGHGEVLDHAGMFVGAWIDADRAYLDITEVIEDREVAIYAGAARNQIAIWSLHDGAEIATGGTGQ